MKYKKNLHFKNHIFSIGMSGCMSENVNNANELIDCDIHWTYA